MKAILAVCTVALAVSSGIPHVSAQGRPDVTRMTCSQAKAFIDRRGDVVVSTGGRTYERVVSNRRFCALGEIARKFRAPTQDNRACLIGRECRFPNIDSGGGL